MTPITTATVPVGDCTLDGRPLVSVLVSFELEQVAA